MSWERRGGRELSVDAQAGEMGRPTYIINSLWCDRKWGAFVCQPDHLTLGCVWLKRSIYKSFLTKTQALPRLYDPGGAYV